MTVNERSAPTGREHARNTRAPVDGTHGGGSYLRFAAMILTSTAVMLALMYANVWQLDHVRWSQTKGWMALYMGGAMALIMLGFMLGMYRDKTRNRIVVGLAVAAFAGGLYLMRSQDTVGDVAWMKAMIPHHSLAILTSERATITDPRVKALAREIIEVQREEIAEMERYIADIEVNGEAPPGTPRTKQ